MGIGGTSNTPMGLYTCFHYHTEGIGGAANIPGVLNYHRQMNISVRKIILDIHLWMRIGQEIDVIYFQQTKAFVQPCG